MGFPPRERLRSTTAFLMLVVMALSSPEVESPPKKQDSVQKTEIQTSESPEPIKQVEEPKQEIKRAVAYKVIGADDYSFPGRKRVRWQIVSPEAKTNLDRAYTVIQAAKDLYNETKADQVNIWMEMDEEVTGKGFLYAMATYTPDGKGNSGKERDENIWEVKSSNDRIDDAQVIITRAWYDNRDKFIDKDGIVDEQRLKAHLAKALALPVEKITLPWITTQKFVFKDEDYRVAGSKLPESIANPVSFSKSKCEMDLSCWAEKHLVAASVKAPQLIERFAKYDFKWTDGILTPKFSHFRWKNMEKGIITYIGDQIQFQNGFGAWQNCVYECDYDPRTESILDIRINAGRL